MHICLYTSTALPLVGGQELVVDALARQYVQQGHRVVVLAPRPSRDPRAADEGLPYQVARHPRFVSTKRLVAWYGIWLTGLARRQPFDVLHCHDVYPTGFVGAMSRRRLNCPLVLTSHGGDVHPHNHRLAHPLILSRYRQALAAADAVIAISPHTRDCLERLAPDGAHRIVDLPNGTDLTGLADLAPKPAAIPARVVSGNFFLYLGRLTRQKGVDTLVSAWSQLAPAERRTLVVAGEGNERSRLQAQALGAGLARQIVFLGEVHGAVKTWLLQHALGVLLPSKSAEGLPLVLLEALAAGRPVLGSDVPGISGFLDSGRTGWVIQPDAPAVWANSIRQVLEHPEHATRVGRQGRLAVSRLSWPAVAQQHLRLYGELSWRARSSVRRPFAA